MHQIAMTGEDWTSDRDRKAAARAQAARKKAALLCSKRLDAAAESVGAFLHACRDCRDDSGDERMGLGDGRHRLIHDLIEYSYFLQSVYGRES